MSVSKVNICEQQQVFQAAQTDQPHKLSDWAKFPSAASVIFLWLRSLETTVCSPHEAEKI